MRRIHITIDDSNDVSRAIISSDIDKPVDIRAPSLEAAAKMVEDLNKTSDEIAKAKQRKIDRLEFLNWHYAENGYIRDGRNDLVNAYMDGDGAILQLNAANTMRKLITFCNDTRGHGGNLALLKQALIDEVCNNGFGEDLE